MLMQFPIALNASVHVKFNLKIQIRRMYMSVIFDARQFRYDFNRVHCFIKTNITEPRRRSPHSFHANESECNRMSRILFTRTLKLKSTSGNSSEIHKTIVCLSVVLNHKQRMHHPWPHASFLDISTGISLWPHSYL